MNKPILETVTGKLIDPENPQVDQIDIEDIAWGLSRISRFCGHTITPIPYNVAQHSILVADRVQEQMFVYGTEFCEHNGLSHKTVLKALLHDASEVYTGDVPSPIKKIPSLLPVFKELEHKLMSAVYEKFGLTECSNFETTIIKEADKWSQKVEAHAFMPSRGIHWIGMPNVTLEELQNFEAPKSALESYRLFKEKFSELRILILEEIENSN